MHINFKKFYFSLIKYIISSFVVFFGFFPMGFLPKSTTLYCNDISEDNFEYKIGLNFKYNQLNHRLDFNEFLSTNRPDFQFNNFKDNTLQPELYLEYKLNDLINVGMNASFLKFTYNDNTNEQFLVSNQGTPTLANIRTTTLTNFNTFILSPKFSLNYDNFALNTTFNVFFCLILT